MTQVRLMLVLMIIGTLQGYGLQFLLLGEDGGPAGRGMVPGLWMFNRAFIAGELGYACALGLFLFVFILVLTLINNKYVRVDK
jgi:raffinose/stachyose/melibiose transport system permease protein